MKFWLFFKQMFVQLLLWLALLLAMGASLSHVAYSFNRFELAKHWRVGWLAAVGVDLGLVCLAVGIQRYRQRGRKSTSLWFALAFVTAISVLANVSHGVHVVTGDHLKIVSFASFDWLETVTMLLLAGCLPVLVFALTEVAASDTGMALEAIRKETRRLEHQRQKEDSTEGIGAFPMPVGEARHRRKLNAEQAEAGFVAFIEANPNLAGMTYEQIGAQFDRSRQWVSTKICELEERGRIETVKDNGGIMITVKEM